MIRIGLVRLDRNGLTRLVWFGLVFRVFKDR